MAAAFWPRTATLFTQAQLRQAQQGSNIAVDGRACVEACRRPERSFATRTAYGKTSVRINPVAAPPSSFSICTRGTLSKTLHVRHDQPR